MKSKQLANVLIKILGLSMFVNGIPGVFSVLLGAMRIRGSGIAGELFLAFLTSLITPAIGIYFILQTPMVTTFLFGGEDE